MLKLHKDLPKARTDHEKTAIERQIAATDEQIDSLVYELYGLVEKEIRIVEKGEKCKTEQYGKSIPDSPGFQSRRKSAG